METIDTLEGRVAKAVQAAKQDVLRELARARLDRTRALPAALDALGWTPPASQELNSHYERLGFVELLVADGAGPPSTRAEVRQATGSFTAALAKLHVGAGPLAVHQSAAARGYRDELDGYEHERRRRRSDGRSHELIPVIGQADDQEPDGRASGARRMRAARSDSVRPFSRSIGARPRHTPVGVTSESCSAKGNSLWYE